MAPRRTRAREEKSAAPSPSPSAPGRARASRSRSVQSTQSIQSNGGAPSTDDESDSGGGVGVSVPESVEEESEEEEVAPVEEKDDDDGEVDQAQVREQGSKEEQGKMSREERMAKLKELRAKMNQSTAANRRDLIADHQKSKVTAKEIARLEKQRKLAQTLRLKAEAEETGEDLERKKNWEWSIEQNERWEKKMAEQEERSDTRFHNAEDDAHKLYKRNIRSTKADLLSYERQKEAALGLAPGTLVPIGTTSQQLAVAGPSKGSALTREEDLYRGADTLAYGDNKPSEEAVDRVIGKINKDLDKGKRKKKEEDDGEINYINDRNKVFNKKIARYFDKYTKEIRANFERGTAL